MKKILSLTAILLALIMVFPYTSAVAEVEITDVPVIYITTDGRINRDEYISAKIVVDGVTFGDEYDITDDSAKIKIRGNSTSSGAKKPYNIKFSSKEDLLGMGKSKKWCLLANCYEKTLIRSELAFEFARETRVKYTADSRFCDVYVNGTFMGSYLVTEAVETSSNRVDIDIDNDEFLFELDAYEESYFYSPVYNLRMTLNEPETPTLEQTKFLMDFLTKAENAFKSGDFDEMDKYIDIESFVDFYICIEYLKNVDASSLSTRFYIKEGKLYAGPVWDFDLSMGNCSSSYYRDYNNVKTSNNSYEGIWHYHHWFKAIINNEIGMSMIKARYLDLQDVIVNMYSNNILGKSRVDSLTEKYSESFNRNYALAGWSINSVYSELERIPNNTYKANVDYLRNWLENRNEWLLEYWDLDNGGTLKTKSNSGLTVSDGYILGIPQKAELSTVLSSFTTPVLSGRLHGYACTGQKVYAEKGGRGYALVIYGDVNGDSEIKPSDYMMIKRACLGTYTLTDAAIKAACVSGGNELKPLDYMMIKRHCLGTYNIYQK